MAASNTVETIFETYQAKWYIIWLKWNKIGLFEEEEEEELKMDFDCKWSQATSERQGICVIL